jgi:hypothetical protein
MADDWSSFEEVKGEPSKANPWDAFPVVSKKEATKKIATTPGQKQSVADEELVAKSRGMIPDEVKAGLYAAGESGAFNLPSHAAAAYTAYTEKKPYTEAYQEQRAYEEALKRQSPTGAAIGTGAGFVGGMLTPLGPIGTAAKAAKLATAAKFGETAGKMAEGAVIGSALSGISGTLRDLDVREGLKDAAIGAGLGAALQPVVGSLSRYLTKMPKVLDEAGNLTDEAKAVVQRAFKGKISPEESDAFIASFQDKLVEKFQKKGATEAAAKEALLEKEGIKPTRSMVTGEAAPKAAEDITAGAAQKAEEKLAARGEELAGRPVEEGALAEALHKKMGEERAAASEPFKKMANLESKLDFFTEESFGLFMPAIQKRLHADQKPISAEDLGNAGYTQAAKAFKFLEEGIAAGNLPLKDINTGVDIANIANFEATRRALNNFSQAAKGPDRAAMSNIRKGFDDAYDEALTRRMFTGDADAVKAQLEAARNGWKDFKARFSDKYQPSGTKFTSAINEMIDKTTGQFLENPTAGAFLSANQVLASGLINPRLGLATFERLEKAFGAGSPEMKLVEDQIRSKILRPEKGMSDIPKNIDKFLSENRAIAERVFNGRDGNPSIIDLRRFSEAVKIINERPIPQKEKDLKILAVGEKLLKWGVSGAAGYMSGIPAGLATYIGSTGAEKGVGAVRSAIQRGAERAGAPSERPAVSLPLLPAGTEIRGPVRTLAPFESSGEEEGYGPPMEVRTQRATGGRISDTLVKAAEAAKRSITNETKPLLDAHDNHIAHALEVANRTLEG